MYFRMVTIVAFHAFMQLKVRMILRPTGSV